VLDIDVVAHPQAVQDRISYMPQRFGLYEDLSVQENLDLYADLHGVPQTVRTERFTLASPLRASWGELHEREVLIVDFKTNRPPPANESQVPEVYLAQMALYREGAKKLFGDRRVVCGLVFTDGPKLLQLSDVVLDARIAAISARLDPEGGRS